MKLITILRVAVVAVCLSVLAYGCAPSPQPDPTSARELVAKAYASGASRLAAEDYAAASTALSNAEQQIQRGEKKLAWESLRRARQHALDSLKITEQEKQKRLEAIRRQDMQQNELKPVVVKPEPIKVLPPKPVAPKPVAPKPKPQLVNQVEVREGETLSNIAARQEVYGDPLLWPLVYKANRDQIKDPKRIFPGQSLVIPRDKSEEEKEAAREEARSLELFR